MTVKIVLKKKFNKNAATCFYTEYAKSSCLTLQLCKDQHHFEHRFTHRRRRVELLIARDKRHAEHLQFLIHLGEVEQVSADTVNLPDEQMGVHTVPNLHHHFLKGRPISILSRIACILKNGIVADVQSIFAVADKVFPLHGQAVTVYLIRGRNTQVYGRPLRLFFWRVDFLLSHCWALSFGTYFAKNCMTFSRSSTLAA